MRRTMRERSQKSGTERNTQLKYTRSDCNTQTLNATGPTQSSLPHAWRLLEWFESTNCRLTIKRSETRKAIFKNTFTFDYMTINSLISL